MKKRRQSPTTLRFNPETQESIDYVTGMTQWSVNKAVTFLIAAGMASIAGRKEKPTLYADAFRATVELVAAQIKADGSLIAKRRAARDANKRLADRSQPIKLLPDFGSMSKLPG